MRSKKKLERTAPDGSWFEIKEKARKSKLSKPFSAWKNRDICDNMLAKLLAHEIAMDV